MSFARVLKGLKIPSINGLPQEKETLKSLLEQGKQLALAGHDSTALLSWSKAADISPSETLDYIKIIFNQWRLGGTDEALLTAGLMLVKLEKATPTLTNFLGNLARRQDNPSLAKKLYAVGVKANPMHKLSLFNMAATTAKIDLYDAAIPELIKKHLPDDHLCLPAFQTDAQLIQKLTQSRREINLKNKDERLNELINLQDQAERKMDALKVHGYSTEANKLKAWDGSPTAEEILEVIQKEVDRDLAQPERVSPLYAQKRQHDLGLFALTLEKGELALPIFAGLINQNAPLPYLKMLHGLAVYQVQGLDPGLEALNDCLHQDPKDRYANANLGLLHSRAGHRYSAAMYRLIAANLLECSHGHFHYPDFMAEAQKAYEDPNQQNLARKLYNQISLEVEDPVVWARLAKLEFDREHLREAAHALKEWLRLEPTNQYAKEKLSELADSFLTQGDALEKENKFRPAMKIYLQAASIAKTPELLKRLEEGYYRLKQPLKAKEAAMERHIMVLMEQRRKAALEQEKLLKSGMAFLKTGSARKAITVLEKALSYKANLSIYRTLCALYQEHGLETELGDLERRWTKMMQVEEEQMKLEKEFHWYYAGL